MGEFSISRQTLLQMMEVGKAPLVRDVRKQEAFSQSDRILPGAQWQDHRNVAGWCAELPKDEPVVIYCVHGHEVSQGVTAELRALGYDARYLSDGIEGWNDAGYRVVSKPGGKA